MEERIKRRNKIFGISAIVIFFIHSILLATNELILTYNTLETHFDINEITRYFQISEKILRYSCPLSFIYLVIGLSFLAKIKPEQETETPTIRLTKRISLIYLAFFLLITLVFFFGSYESYLVNMETLDIVYGLLFLYTLPFVLICFFLGISFVSDKVAYKILGVLVAIAAYYGSFQFVKADKSWIFGLFGSLLLFFFGISFFVVGMIRKMEAPEKE